MTTLIPSMSTFVIRGCLLGIVSATLTAFTFVLLIPEARFQVWELWAVPSLLVWALFLGWLPGLMVGGGAGAVLAANSQRLASPKSQNILAAIVAVIAVAIVQLMLPRAWNLPRVKISVILTPQIFLLTRVSILVLMKTDTRNPSRDR